MKLTLRYGISLSAVAIALLGIVSLNSFRADAVSDPRHDFCGHIKSFRELATENIGRSDGLPPTDYAEDAADVLQRAKNAGFSDTTADLTIVQTYLSSFAAGDFGSLKTMENEVRDAADRLDETLASDCELPPTIGSLTR